MDPGEHVIEASAPGFRKTSAKVQVATYNSADEAIATADTLLLKQWENIGVSRGHRD